MTKEGSRTGGFLAIEEAPGGGRTWFLLLAGLILARNLLESIVEIPQQIGFDWRGEISLPMFFLHFPLFYLALFLLLALWLHAVAGRPLARVARIVTSGFALLLLVPLVDRFVSGGAGYDLKYLGGLDPEILRFWDPGAALHAVSPGQRIEIVLATLLAGLYAGWARRRGRGATAVGGARAAGGSSLRALVWGLLGAAGAYALIALLGAWPAIFARWASPAGVALGASFARVFQGSGLVADESRRLAIAVALPALAAFPVFLWRLDPRAFAALARRGIGTRMLHYTGLAPAGAWVGALVYRDALPWAFGNPIDLAALVVLWASLAAAFTAALLWNDLHDLACDRWNAPARPVPSRSLSEERARSLAAAAAGVALFLAFCVGHTPGLLMLGCLWLAWLYSAPPVRLKRWPGAATFTLALLSLISLASGYALFAQEMTARVLPGRLALLLLAGITLGFTAKDLRDAEGDRRCRVHTLATLLPARAARALTAALVAGGFLLAPLCLPLGPGFSIAAVLAALLGAALTLRRARPDGALLLLFIAFELLVLVLLGGRPEQLREAVPRELRELHARTRAVEEPIRIARRLQEARGGGGLATGAPAGPEAIAGESAHPAADPGEASLATILPELETLLALAQAAPRIWSDRLRWARAQAAASAVAAEDLGALAARHPLHAGYLEGHLAAESARGEGDAARALATEAVSRGVRPGDFLRHRAALALAAEDARAAAADLGRAFLFGSEEPTLRVLLGDLHLARGEPSEAAASYRAALARAPFLADAWNGLGQALHASGDAAAAREALIEAARRAPGDPWVRNNLGVVLRDAGRLEEACAQFEESCALAPRLFEAHFNLAQVEERLGRPAEALAACLRARALRPGFPPVEAALARLRGGPADSSAPR